MPKGWREDFDNVSLEGLRKRGWEVLDLDTAWFSKQLKEGHLTLYTLPGDYWVKKEEPRKIRNLLVRKIAGGDFTITAKITDFNPHQSCQTASVFLLDENLRQDNWVDASFSFWRDPDSINGGSQSLAMVQQENGEVSQVRGRNVGEFKWAKKAGAQTVWIRINIEGRQLTISNRVEKDWYHFADNISNVKLNFQPAYVGVASFQGWTKYDRTPWGADTIPAFFDYLIFEPGKQE